MSGPIYEDSDMPACLNTWEKQAEWAKQLLELHSDGKVKELRSPFVQGCFSRTVLITLESGMQEVVQFRTELVDTAPFDLAQQILGDLVPTIKRIQDVRLGTGIYTYRLSCIPGKTWMEAGDGQDSRMRLPVVRSLAKVLSRGRVCDDSTSVVDHLLRPHLQLILSSDDPVICPFQQAAGFLYGKLDSLKGLPLFLSHFDLNDMNIMVSDDFEVSGLIDWEFSSPLPFGVGFSRIDSLAGEYHEGCFCMLDDFEEVERAFWSEILKGIPESTRLLVTETPELVQTAVTLGILLEAFQLENGRLGPYSEVAVRALPKLLTYRIPMIRGPDSPPYSI